VKVEDPGIEDHVLWLNLSSCQDHSICDYERSKVAAGYPVVSVRLIEIDFIGAIETFGSDLMRRK
jgi:hypothetical protein